MSTPALRPAPPTPEEIPCLPRNFWAWVAYQFFYRIGWQFKMESTMMAGLISYLAPAPTVMGLFASLNKVGQNLAPLIAAPIVDRFRQKVMAVLLFWGLTVASWAALTIYLWSPAAGDRAQSLWVFGLCYSLFFTFLGAVSVAQGALLGKIIPAERRGQAMAVGMMLSGVINVGAILLLYRVIGKGHFPEPRNYALAFTLTTLFFVLAGASLLWVREAPSPPAGRRTGLYSTLRAFVVLTRYNRNLARLMVVNIAVSISGSMLQFYTGYWRQSGTFSEGALVLATLFQVLWQSVSSSIFGRAADRKGNRLIICILLWVEAMVPLAALVLGGLEPFRGHWAWFTGVYALVGFRFPLYQLLVNYLLEVVPQRDHAMALGAVTTAQLTTVPAPLVLGAIAGIWGYAAAFLIASGIVAYAAIIALGMDEVRLRKSSALEI
ncbi:MAG TPA: MFS transporter [Chthonomonadaceae bacterium]|nr:MFS transporter [Chthonomonadaceae bacterium]